MNCRKISIFTITLISSVIFAGCETYNEVYGEVEEVKCLVDSDGDSKYSDVKIKEDENRYRADSKYCETLKNGDNIVINFYLGHNSKVQNILKVEDGIE